MIITIDTEKESSERMLAVAQFLRSLAQNDVPAEPPALPRSPPPRSLVQDELVEEIEEVEEAAEAEQKPPEQKKTGSLPPEIQVY